MKTIKILILIAFLFAGQAYLCLGAPCNLRAPLISNNVERLKEATEKVTAWEKLGFWNRLIIFSKWKKLIYQKSETEEEAKAVLSIMGDLYKELSDQRADPKYIRYISEKAIPAVFKAAKDAHEVAMFLGFGLERAIARQDIGPTLYGISQIVKIAHTREEKRAVCDIMAELNEKSLRGIIADPGKLIETNFIIANTVANISELRQVDGIVSKIKEKTMGNPIILVSLTPRHIGEAIKLQKQEGDFDINLAYTRNGIYKIEIVPASRPALAAARLASGHTLEGKNILIVQDYPSIIDGRKFQLIQEGAKEENITVASDYETAIKALDAKRFDLVILDMGFDIQGKYSSFAGLSVLEYIVSHNMRAPVLIDSSTVSGNLDALHRSLKMFYDKYPNLAEMGKDEINKFVRVFPEADNLQQFLQHDLDGLRSAL